MYIHTHVGLLPEDCADTRRQRHTLLYMNETEKHPTFALDWQHNRDRANAQRMLMRWRTITTNELHQNNATEHHQIVPNAGSQTKRTTT